MMASTEVRTFKFKCSECNCLLGEAIVGSAPGTVLQFGTTIGYGPMYCESCAGGKRTESEARVGA